MAKVKRQNKYDIKGGRPPPWWVMPEARYLCDTINIDPETRDTIDLVKYWRPDEKLWLGNIPYSALLFDPDEEIIGDITAFYKGRHWEYRLDKEDPTIVQTFAGNMIAENFIKMCWLTDEFFKGGMKFRNPLGVHYNPRIDAHVIHPGGCRNKVVKLFADKHRGIKSWYFNTRGAQPAWLNQLKPVDVEATLNSGFAIGIVPDHGTLIPHVAKEVELIAGNIIDYYANKIHQLNYEPRQFESNRPLPMLENWKDSTSGTKIKFEFKLGASQMDIMAAYILFAVGLPYENRFLKVTVE